MNCTVAFLSLALISEAYRKCFPETASPVMKYEYRRTAVPCIAAKSRHGDIVRWRGPPRLHSRILTDMEWLVRRYTSEIPALRNAGGKAAIRRLNVPSPGTCRTCGLRTKSTVSAAASVPRSSGWSSQSSASAC
jgi:hypothetical protein